MNILMLDYKRQLILDKIKMKDEQQAIYLICKIILKKSKVLISEKEILISTLESLKIIEKNGLFKSWIYDFIEIEL